MKSCLKRILSGVLALLLLVLPLFALPVHAENGNITVKVGFFAYPGYHEYDGNVRSGYGYDFLMLLQRYTHLNFEFVGYDNTWEEMQEMLLNGEIDLVTSARKTPQRERLYGFSEPIGTNSAQINVCMEDENYIPGNYEPLNGITIGVLAGNSRNADLAAFALEKGFRYIAKEYPNAEEMDAALKSGEISAVATSSLRKSSGEKTIAEFAPQDFYAIVRKNDNALLNEINYGISMMDANEGNWRDNLHYKNYHDAADTKLSFSQREKQYIVSVLRDRKKVTVTAPPDREPYSFVENGKLVGIIPDYFDHLMKMAGIPYTTLVAENMEEFQTWTTSDHTDIVLDFGYDFDSSGKYPDCLKTDPYMQLTTAKVTRKNFSGEIRSIAADAQNDQAIPENLSDDAEFILVENWQEAMQAVADGKADACYMFTYAAEKFINSNPNSNLQTTILTDPVYNEYLCINPDSDHELCSILNKCINADASGILDEYVKKYTTVTYQQLSLWNYLKFHPELVSIASGLLVILAVFVASAVVKARTEKLRNAQLEKDLEHHEKLAESLTFTNFFLDTFVSAYYVNLETGECRIYKRTKMLEQDYPVADKYYDFISEYIKRDVHPEDREELAAISSPKNLKKLLKEKQEFTHVFRDISGGTEKIYRMQAIRGADDSHAALGFVDITEELRTQEEQQRQMGEALAMAQSANRAKTAFLNNMSHDIRTPMNAIIGYTALAANHIDNKEQVQDYLSKIGQSSDHLLSLINDVLDMSRIESGKMNLEEKPESLPDIIHTLRDIVQADIHAKQHEFLIDTINVNDEQIICDKLRLNQVLLNILSNAIKYTAPGGTISMRISEKASAFSGYATYEFRIKDNGMGMDEEYLKTIFDPFTRVRSSTVSGIQGTGLGMAITKNIVDMMGGRIDISSEPGKGTEMTVTFDFKLHEANKETISIEELQGVRALVVDDDANTVMSVAKMVMDVGMRSDWCTNGKEALLRAEYAYNSGDPFKVYIIDWLMPDLNGLETARRLRKLAGEDIPIIVLTAYDWADIEDDAKKAGVTSFARKPLFLSDLSRVLNACFCSREEENDTADGFDFAGKKLLLVEDNAMNREIAAELLEEEGFVVETAEDGDIAVEKIKAAGAELFDIVLMDIQMPKMDGYEATRQIRALGAEFSRMPIIAMTANAFEEDRKLAFDAGMNEHISKPIDIGKLNTVLAKFL